MRPGFVGIGARLPCYLVKEHNVAAFAATIRMQPAQAGFVNGSPLALATGAAPHQSRPTVQEQTHAASRQPDKNLSDRDQSTG